jgi:hypothetical protein
MRRSLLTWVFLSATGLLAGLALLSPVRALAQVVCQDCQSCQPPFNPAYTQCCLHVGSTCGTSKYCVTQISNVSDCVSAGDICGGHTTCTGGNGGGGNGGGGGACTAAYTGFCPAECFSCGGSYY